MISINLSKEDDNIIASFAYNEDTIRRIKDMPSRKYLPNRKVWSVPFDDFRLLLDKLGDEYYPVLDATLSSALLDIGIDYEGDRQREVERIKEEKVLSTRERLKDIKPKKDFCFKVAPLPHQIEAFNVGLDKNRLIIGDEQGLGKSFESITIMSSRHKDGLISKCLIICGVNTTKYNWIAEISKFSDEDAVLIDGTNEKRKKLINDWLSSESLFGVINIEAIRNDDIRELLVGKVQAIIFDEVHKVKNGRSKQGSAIQELKAKYMIALTGTLLTRTPMDCHNVLSWLDFYTGNFWKFRSKYAVMGGFEGREIVGYKNLDDLHSLIDSHMLRRTKEEVIDLPDKIFKTEYVELSKQETKGYEEILDGLLQMYDEILEMSNPLNTTLRLRQCTDGLFHSDKSKIVRLKELVDDIVAEGGKVIVFSSWEQVTQMAKEALKDYSPAYIVGSVDTKKRAEEVERFQTTKDCNVIIGTIGAMGTGITLNKANNVIFLDKAWTYADNAQAIDRSHRIGTEHSVNVITLVAKDTIDEKIEQILDEQKELFDMVMDGIDVPKMKKKDLMDKLLK